MLRKLRWQLSALYVLAALVLVSLIGGGAYGLLAYYFRSSNDLALQYKVAHELVRTGQPVPADLQAIELAWQSSRSTPLPSPSPFRYADTEGEEEDHIYTGSPTGNEAYEEYYDSELASIYLLTVDRQGEVVSSPSASTLALDPDQNAVQTALNTGSDFRTVRLADGSRVRLFSYRVGQGDDLAVLQVGRSLTDQDRVLGQLLIGLIALGGLSVALIGLGSWWLAGRSLIPAQKAWDRQQAFIANASHELRAPLTLLRASAEVAQRGLGRTDPHRELLGDILDETDHMNKLVEDLLLLSRLDAGQLKLEREVVDLQSLLASLAREMGRVAVEQGVTLEVLQIKGSAAADPTRLRQVLLIILDNALLHTPSGGTIWLAAREGDSQVTIEVSDNGSGIPSRHLPHVFERFYRGESDRSQEGRGSGLGLSIARGLMEAMGGKIELKSQAGEGTQVSIHLPAA